ncbi:MAG: helix-turn-helix domain-containing protein, partial [Gammaproteobacteria bacterium]|nr:helix-turn-helix domain-containing protein [Gammaproteobacteria bacterium]
PSRFMQVGAAGYLTKGCGVDELVRAIETVHKGGRYLAGEVAQGMALSLLPGGEESPFEKLSERELQVMLMVAKGWKVADISDKLCLSPKTVNTYRYRLFEKLGVQGDVDLTHLAMRYGVID